MHQGSRFALKALMYTGPPTWVSSYSIPIFSHLEVSDLGEPFILHNDQDLVSCLLPSNEKMPSTYQYYTLRLFSVISSDNYKHRKLPIFMQFFYFIWCNAKMCFEIKNHLQVSNSLNKWE